jgi:putative flavoprotein involved in K+ transport
MTFMTLTEHIKDPQAEDRVEHERVVVVGGGPAGLAVAAVLKSKQIDAVILDRAESVGASWMAHYDRLHLHTVRWLSHLPGLRLPRSDGKWVARDAVVRYLQNYADHHALRLRLATRATSVRREGSVWKVETNDGLVSADAVVIATGHNDEPVMPKWAGRDGFAGELQHSSAYRSGLPYAGKAVLVVGAGNSGAEIAVDLVEHHARKVWLSVRTAPNILRRDLAGLPTQAIGVLLRRLPVSVVDKIAGVTQRLTVGDLTKYGMPRPDRGLYTRVRHDDRIPILDVGLIGALKRGEVEVVPAVEALDGPDVILVGGRRVTAQAVVAATGFRRGLEELAGQLGVLDASGTPLFNGATTDPRLPDLYFIGYSNPLSGNLRELGIDARRIAHLIEDGSANRAS